MADFNADAIVVIGFGEPWKIIEEMNAPCIGPGFADTVTVEAARVPLIVYVADGLRLTDLDFLHLTIAFAGTEKPHGADLHRGGLEDQARVSLRCQRMELRFP